MGRVALLLLVTQTLVAREGPLSARIDVLLKDSPVVERAYWGIQILDLRTGQLLYNRNQDKLFTPASNTKLFSTALALQKLGPDHRFYTRVVSTVPAAPDGILRSDLLLMGGGDMTLSARSLPYRPGPVEGDPLAPLASLADQVVAAGVNRIEGDVVGDDTAYVWEPYPDGWTVDDAIWEYGAPASALIVGDNSIRITLQPSASSGGLAGLLVSPAFEYYVFQNHVETTAGGTRKISVHRLPASRLVRLWGTLPSSSRPSVQYLAVDDPALYAAEVFQDLLIRRGVQITGEPVARHLLPGEIGDLTRGPNPRFLASGIELAKRTSPPLIESLRVIDKISQNLQAEVVLREVGRIRRDLGSREAGLAELEAFLSEIGILPEAYHFEDASGLSRKTLVSPSAVVSLLRHMYHSPQRDAWLGLLPVGGEDGTLEHRYRGTAAAGRVRAKTGTISHVSALSGYVDGRRGGQLAFSILANHYDVPAAAVRDLTDKIVNLLASQW
ncbi:MAG: D-alanyl-D-alanine carboxypeptidase/D-alanyl-D-alanine-endopeptidase [Bryobacterales bacterium]|nr:D-alanyl-D-alanine carboxypeptidase/D-alanyl-D-alanine-endopeptidase [Bryobacterales bacterium]MEB2362501.1 D-alanyl-D-alanine carboxypeptidase/D-alanyl-D-alanine-endopeptidase [Bryobacterales bacterium]